MLNHACLDLPFSLSAAAAAATTATMTTTTNNINYDPCHVPKTWMLDPCGPWVDSVEPEGTFCHYHHYEYHHLRLPPR